LRFDSIFSQRWFRIILSYFFVLKLSHCNFYHLTNKLKFWFYFTQQWRGIKTSTILDIIILSSNQLRWWDYFGCAPHLISCWWWFQCQYMCMTNFWPTLKLFVHILSKLNHFSFEYDSLSILFWMCTSHVLSLSFRV
jgi:hypothetical protein